MAASPRSWDLQAGAPPPGLLKRSTLSDDAWLLSPPLSINPKSSFVSFIVCIVSLIAVTALLELLTVLVEYLDL